MKLLYIITGSCDCGTELKIKIRRDAQRVVLDCFIQIKKGKCGKRGKLNTLAGICGKKEVVGGVLDGMG